MKGAAKERDPNTETARKDFKIFYAKAGHFGVGSRFVLLDGVGDVGGVPDRLRNLIFFTTLWMYFVFL